jgi:hypothetical protein
LFGHTTEWPVVLQCHCVWICWMKESRLLQLIMCWKEESQLFQRVVCWTEESVLFQRDILFGHTLLLLDLLTRVDLLTP